MLKKTFRAALSLLLVFSLLLGVSANGLVVLAEGNDEASQKGTLNYVSIGDSMTNGYGFEGYNQDGHVWDYDEYDFFKGINVYGDGSYALQFENYLAGKGYDVNHTKLALSGLRAEDVAFLLDKAEEPADGYFQTCWSYAYWGYTNFVPGTSQGWSDYNHNKYAKPEQIEAQLTQMKEYYQTSMKDADIISLALGNASFNAYFIDRMMKVFGAMGDGFSDTAPQMTLEDALKLMESEEDKQLVRDVYAKLLVKLEEVVPADMMEQFKIKDLCDLTAYITASFALNYKLVIEWIAENNPDAQVILVAELQCRHDRCRRSRRQQI